MAGIGDESFHLRRGLLLLVEALLYSGEHGVERDRQRTDLRVLRRRGHALCEVAGGDLRGGLLDALQRRQCSLGHQRGQQGAEYDDGHADDDAVTGQCLYGVKLVAQRQTDVAYAAGLAVLIGPRQRHDAPRRFGGGQRGMVHAPPAQRHDGVGGERLLELHASAAAVHRQQRHRTDAVLESGDDGVAQDGVVAVADLHEVAVQQAAAGFLGVILLTHGIDVVEDQLRLTEQLRVRLLQHVVADQLAQRQ